MPWLAVAWITVTRCFTTQKRHIPADYRVQNALCRTVCKLNKYCHITPFLHKLHWLSIHYHILFKYNLLTYKAIHFSQPPYISSLIRWSDLTWGNCLSISSSIFKPNKCSGLRSFIVAAPTEWNKLPQAIRTIESISGFRKQLKTSFQKSYLSCTIAYLPYRMLIWKQTSFWNWTIPFWTSAPYRMFTSILALYKCFSLTLSCTLKVCPNYKVTRALSHANMTQVSYFFMYF